MCKSYPSNLTPEQWELLEPLLPEAKRRGRRRSDLLLILNAIFYVLCESCTWRETVITQYSRLCRIQALDRLTGSPSLHPSLHSMNCPHCHSSQTTQLQRTTFLGYQMFWCQICHRTFNERTGTAFNFLEYPTDIVFEVLFCRLRYKLSFRDIAEFFLLRGFLLTHETVRHWEERFAPIFAQQLRARRRCGIGQVWFVDETYLRIKGKWCYLYRGMDENGNLVDVMLSQKRDMAAAKAFFAQARERVKQVPERVVTDGLSSYPRAIKEALGEAVEHQVRGCLGNLIEQDHRGIKHRYYPMMGFGEFESAQRFCQAHAEIRDLLRPRQRMTEFVSLLDRRMHFIERVEELQHVFKAA